MKTTTETQRRRSASSSSRPQTRPSPRPSPRPRPGPKSRTKTQSRTRTRSQSNMSKSPAETINLDSFNDAAAEPDPGSAPGQDVVDLTSDLAAAAVVDLTNDTVLVVDEDQTQSYVVSSDEEDLAECGTTTTTSSSSSSSTSTGRRQRSSGVHINCPVCMDSYHEIVDSGRLLVSTRCGHVFCSLCLRDSLNHSSSCPICRKKLPKGHYHPLHL